MASLTRHLVQNLHRFPSKHFRTIEKCACVNAIVISKRLLYQHATLQQKNDPAHGSRFSDCKIRGMPVLRDPQLNKVISLEIVTFGGFKISLHSLVEPHC